MTKKQLMRQKQNRDYYKRAKQRGLTIGTFLMPKELMPDVHAYIKQRMGEMPTTNNNN
jgi:hypothetical protein